MLYKVLVTEVRRKTIAVDAGSEREAHQRAHDAWMNTEFRLGEEDFDGVEFYVTGESGDGKEKRGETILRKE